MIICLPCGNVKRFFRPSVVPGSNVPHWSAETLSAELSRIEFIGFHGTARIDLAINVLTSIYTQTHFPEQQVSWRTYPNHIGHRSFPGCFRCHNREHESAEGATISMDCNLCHEFVFQAHGEETYGRVKYETQRFQHPGGEEEIWQDLLCTDCHAPES